MATGASAAGGGSGDGARLRALLRALVRRFALSERADVMCCGLTVAQAAALEALSCDEPLRLGALARRLGIAPSTLTRNLAPLEADGLVRRVSDLQDGRAFRVALSPAGERAARRVTHQEDAFAADVLARLPAERRKTVVGALAELLEAVRAATEVCCPGAFDHLLEGAGPGAGRAGEKSHDDQGCGPSC